MNEAFDTQSSNYSVCRQAFSIVLSYAQMCVLIPNRLLWKYSRGSDGLTFLLGCVKNASLLHGKPFESFRSARHIVNCESEARCSLDLPG